MMAADVVEVDLGGRTATVPKGGLYDRYRMDADLDAVAADPRVRSVDFFRTLPKTEVQSAIGPTRTPNFYYAMSKAQLTYLAPTSALRSRLPRELDPLQIAPGIGLFSVVFFRYDVCDIDFYTEAAVGVAVRAGGAVVRIVQPLEQPIQAHAIVLSVAAARFIDERQQPGERLAVVGQKRGGDERARAAEQSSDIERRLLRQQPV